MLLTSKCAPAATTPTKIASVTTNPMPRAPWNFWESVYIDNGFLLCPNHDQLFDQGWISFDDTGKILISEGLSQADRCFTNVSENMKIHFPLTAGNRVYLKYHRENIFKG